MKFRSRNFNLVSLPLLLTRINSLLRKYQYITLENFCLVQFTTEIGTIRPQSQENMLYYRTTRISMAT